MYVLEKQNKREPAAGVVPLSFSTSPAPAGVVSMSFSTSPASRKRGAS
jgi:hypothetical protein